LITANRNPEQLARDKIDSELLRCGWLIQNKSSINLTDRFSIAGFTDYRDPKPSSGPVPTFHLIRQVLSVITLPLFNNLFI
jgi:type I restriction enzyme, R subunit